jgi:hypothetical protein
VVFANTVLTSLASNQQTGGEVIPLGRDSAGIGKGVEPTATMVLLFKGVGTMSMFHLVRRAVTREFI